MAKDKRIEWFVNAAGEYQFEVVAGNNKVTEVGEGYSRKDSMMEAARRDFPGLELVEVNRGGGEGSGALIDEPGQGQV